MHRLVWRERIVEKMISIMMGSLAGALALFLVLGAAFGALRGGKRAALRLVTVVVAMILALLMTPAMSRILVGMKVPGMGKSAGDFLQDTLFSGGVMGEIAENSPDIVTFVKACAVVILNFIMFFILYFVFKGISWIVYAVLARVLAPNKVKDEKAKDGKTKVARKYRLAGMGIGLVTGVVLFAFFMIPLTGVMQTVDAAASYKVSFAGYNETTKEALGEETGLAGTIIKVNNTLDDVNGQIQSSFFGRVSKYTGLQVFGGWGTGYLSTVKTSKHKANLRSDMTKFGRAANDALAVVVEVTREGPNVQTKIEAWTDADYKMLQGMVRNIFGIGIVNMALDYVPGIVDSLEEKGTLDGMFNSIGGEGFAPKGYNSLRKFGEEGALRDDLIGFIDAAKLYAKRVVNTVSAVGKGGSSFGDRITAFDKEAIAGVLDTVTNSKTIGQMTRAILSAQIGKIGFGSTEGIDMSTHINKIKAELDGEDELHWDTILGEFISDILRELVQSTTGIGVQIKPGHEAEVAQAMIEASEKFAAAFGGESELNYTDPAAILEIFGDLAALNTPGETPVVTLDLGTITGAGNPEEYMTSVGAAIDETYANDPETAELMRILFGLS